MVAPDGRRAEVVGTRRLQEVSERFAGADELPWMLAAAALIETYKGVSARAEAVLSTFDLTTSRYEILGFLDRAPEGRMEVRDLKRLTFMHPPTMTYTLDWLEERSLVKRSHDTPDRRSIGVSITTKGRKLFQRASEALSKIHFGLAGVEREDAIELTHILSRIRPD
jgi:DNA-binding MarR family transcriptional regulator